MTYFMFFFGICFVFGGFAVAANAPPYYGVVGLVFACVVGCGWLVSLGVYFVARVVFMVYLGGMLVVFVYSVYLAADLFTEGWGDWQVLGYGVGFVLVLGVGVVVGGLVGCLGLGVTTVDSGGMGFGRLDFSGVAVFYSWGGGMFLVAGWGLLLTLFVVLELVRGLARGAIRAV
uniref:NADH-ubiquinone oxidoreductase chain 6 n=1 Tax=Halcyon smyrnensis TaxID=1003843 RepID=A0A343IP83_9AVES|nr:NADH dehydrogenase subunit 6 [Halcyon smyrnensis]ASS35117.1 NADH dehydrogenase subunit 6 [Halcyon smyrnensis]